MLLFLTKSNVLAISPAENQFTTTCFSENCEKRHKSCRDCSMVCLLC